MAEELPNPNEPVPASGANPAAESLSAESAPGAPGVAATTPPTASREPGSAPSEKGNEAKPVELPAFSGGTGDGAPASIDLLNDVALQVKIELGRTRMLVEDVLRLADGAVVELDKLAGDPVDIYVNERHVARGEVLVLNDNFCVRINEILDSSADPKQPVKQAG